MHVAADVPTAIETPHALAVLEEPGTARVLVSGSVVTVADARQTSGPLTPTPTSLAKTP